MVPTNRSRKNSLPSAKIVLRENMLPHNVVGDIMLRELMMLLSIGHLDGTGLNPTTMFSPFVLDIAASSSTLQEKDLTSSSPSPIYVQDHSHEIVPEKKSNSVVTEAYPLSLENSNS
ncbi:hypothetical protein SUGI_0970930 [Cryptomeria japonica]|nr:hypothetical protein SUGI_0970930 [Cryptomeria japonica]